MEYLPTSFTPFPLSHYLMQRKPFTAAQTLYEYSRLSHSLLSLYPATTLTHIKGFLTTGGSISFDSSEAFTQIARIYGRDEVLSFVANWSLDAKVFAFLETPEERPQPSLKRKLLLTGTNCLRISTVLLAPLDENQFKTYCSLKELVETFK